MVRKVYDIYPPNRIQQKEVVKAPRNGLNFKKWGVLLIIIISGTLFLGYSFFPRLEVSLWPKTEVVEEQGVVKLSTEAIFADAEEGVIPGKLLVIEKEETRNFTSSGKETREGKAEGTLKVFNNYSSSPQTLVVNTRFVSATGKMFRAVEKIVIPGKKLKDGKYVPGEVEILVRAAEVGSEYNIEEVTNFSIPGLQGTPMFTTMYAKNTTPIKGGFVGEASKITEEDVVSAREVLLSTIIESVKEDVERNNNDFTFSQDLTEVTIIEESVRPGIGENYESFELSIKAKLRIFTFKESDFNGIVKEFLLNNLEDRYLEGDPIFSEKNILKNSLNIEYEVLKKDFNKEVATLDIQVRALSYPVINKILFKRELSGKNIVEAKLALENHTRIEKVEFDYSPSWIKNIPSENQLRLEIFLD